MSLLSISICKATVFHLNFNIINSFSLQFQQCTPCFNHALYSLLKWEKKRTMTHDDLITLNSISYVFIKCVPVHGNGGGGAWPGMFGMVQNFISIPPSVPWDGCDRIAAMSVSMLQHRSYVAHYRCI